MDLLTVIVLTAALGAVYALAAGITSMMYNREVAHLDSKNWMAWRVLWQSIAVLFMMVGVMGPAPSTAAVERDCVYDYQMMSTAECQAYRERVIAASSADERQTLRDELHRMLDERAAGAPATNWRGLRK